MPHAANARLDHPYTIVWLRSLRSAVLHCTYVAAALTPLVLIAAGCQQKGREPAEQTNRPGTAPLAAAPATAAPVIVKPKAEKTLSMPTYPPDSRRAREAGTVELNLHVLTDGSIDDVGILKSSGSPRLDEYAVREARARWTLKPGTVDGRPTPMWHTLRVTFKLD